MSRRSNRERAMFKFEKRQMEHQKRMESAIKTFGDKPDPSEVKYPPVKTIKVEKELIERMNLIHANMYPSSQAIARIFNPEPESSIIDPDIPAPGQAPRSIRLRDEISYDCVDSDFEDNLGFPDAKYKGPL